jgi:hypothetical protein
MNSLLVSIILMTDKGRPQKSDMKVLEVHLLRPKLKNSRYLEVRLRAFRKYFQVPGSQFLDDLTIRLPGTSMSDF